MHRVKHIPNNCCGSKEINVEHYCHLQHTEEQLGVCANKYRIYMYSAHTHRMKYYRVM